MGYDRAAAGGQTVQLVVFKIGGEEFGVGIEHVKEIIRKPDITPLPDAPPYIPGAINLGGEVIPILSLRERLHLNACVDAEPKVVIVECGGQTVGLEVSQVSEILGLPSDRISQAAPLAAGIASRCITGVCKLKDRLLVILDVERLLGGEDLYLLAPRSSDD